MPSKTAKQARTMAAAAHDPAFARKMNIPQSVAREFNQADEGTRIRSTRPTAPTKPTPATKPFGKKR